LRAFVKVGRYRQIQNLQQVWTISVVNLKVPEGRCHAELSTRDYAAVTLSSRLMHEIQGMELAAGTLQSRKDLLLTL
jgi:hypothetical protein